ncbi:MAG: DUF1080 domain-containing protein [Planctomycetaceae bacterium]
MLVAVGAAFALLLAVGVWFAFFSQGDGTAHQQAGNRNQSGGSIDPKSIPLPHHETGEAHVFTTPHGFAVLVDGEPVRDPDDPEQFLRTPCAVIVPRGVRTITVAKQGFFDASESVSVKDTISRVRLTPREDPVGDDSGAMHGRYFQAEVGRPLPLESLNSPGREFDPFVTDDGLTIWFAAERAEGGGIYSGTRSSPYDEFGPPQLAVLSAGTGADLAGSPSVSADGQLVAFCVPRKARIRGLTRSPEAVLGDFDQIVDLRHGDGIDAYWPAAQLVSEPDGKRVKIYWTEIENGTTRNYVSSRPDPRSSFGDLRTLNLPGGTPCLSADGLRQYVFDGKALRRARRARTSDSFSALETIRELDLPDYQPNSEYRQFFVSFDEQWLFYCPDPEARADLFVVRLANGPGWGHIATGRPIEEPAAIAEAPRDPFANVTTLEVPDRPRSPTAPTEREPDPRATPLPYTTHWREFSQLIAERKYEEAARVLAERDKSPEFDSDRDLLAWDRELLESIRGFWNDVRSGIGTLKPGDEYRQSGVTLVFIRFENDMLTGSLRDDEVEKSIFELRPGDLAAFADRAVAKDDAAAQRRMALFLARDAQAVPAQAKVRFDLAGDARGEHSERLATRILRQAEREIARNNPAAGLAFLAQLRETHPDTAAAAKSRDVENAMYENAKWTTRGGRQWQRGPLGEYAADTQRVADSYLVWPDELERFELKMEWKAADVATAFGGVYFRWGALGGPPQQPNSAFKIQLGNDYRVPPDPTVSGGLFQVEAPLENAVKPAGEWNTFRLRVDGDKVDVWINDKQVLDTVTRNDQIPSRGMVLLDGVSGGISYRKILLLELVE